MAGALCGLQVGRQRGDAQPELCGGGGTAAQHLVHAPRVVAAAQRPRGGQQHGLRGRDSMGKQVRRKRHPLRARADIRQMQSTMRAPRTEGVAPLNSPPEPSRG